MKHAHLYLITKSQQHVHTESITDEPPPRAVLESLNPNSILYICRCIAVICLSVTIQHFFFHTQFTLNHFTLNILPHWHFCSCCCIGWTVGNCAWQSSLWRYYRARAWLQSSSIFISLTCFHICWFLYVDQQTHTCIQMLTDSLSHTNISPYQSLMKIHTLKHKILILINLEFTLCF